MNKNQLSFYALEIDNLEMKLRKIIPFKMISNVIKCSVINLSKEVQDVYTENYKTLINEI